MRGSRGREGQTDKQTDRQTDREIGAVKRSEIICVENGECAEIRVFPRRDHLDGKMRQCMSRSHILYEQRFGRFYTCHKWSTFYSRKRSVMCRILRAVLWAAHVCHPVGSVKNWPSTRGHREGVCVCLDCSGVYVHCADADSWSR